MSIEQLQGQFVDAPADEVIRWAVENFGDTLAIASSFGVEDVVVIDIASRFGSAFRIFMLDTGRLHQETYDTAQRVREKYGIEVEFYLPDRALLEPFVRALGPNAFYDSVAARKECCHIRKVEPLRRALKGACAWMTGLRREQSVTRHALAKVEIDETNGGILKINPLADWSTEEVWTYARSVNVPYNPLHDRGFASIGCAPCTRAVAPGEDIRAGRWWWEQPEQKECGLHRQ